jgi:hypothetical protein
MLSHKFRLFEHNNLHFNQNRNQYILKNFDQLASKETKLLEAMEGELFKEYNPFDKFSEEYEMDQPMQGPPELEKVLELYKEVQEKMAQEEAIVKMKVHDIKNYTFEMKELMEPLDEGIQVNNIILQYNTLYFTKKRMEFKIDNLRRKYIYTDVNDMSKGTPRHT